MSANDADDAGKSPSTLSSVFRVVKSIALGFATGNLDLSDVMAEKNRITAKIDADQSAADTAAVDAWQDKGCPSVKNVSVMKPLKLGRKP